MTKPNSAMSALLDREIAAMSADAFGHRHLAKALESLIENPGNEPPFSIGLLGKWGIGKSTIKSFYLNSLADDRTKSSNSKTRMERIHYVTFNAWRFGGENIKRALLRQVFLALEGDESALNDRLFRQIQRVVAEPRPFKGMLREAYERWIWNLSQVVLIFGFIVLVLYLIGLIFPLADDWAKAAIVTVVSLVGLTILKYLTDPARVIVPRFANFTRVEAPNASAEQYEELLLEQLKKYKAGGTPSKRGRTCERLVIFVDDLDRLSAEEMVSGLDAIRTFMEIPKQQLPKGLGIVFVISCDEDRVADALADRRKQTASSDMPGAVRTHTDARLFLDRIFQFRLDVPPFPKQDMRSYARARLTNDLSDLAADLEAQDVTLDNVIERMIHVGVQSPRNALQILNAFAQTWWIARLREREGAGTDQPGGLQEGAVTNHPMALAALSAIRVNFPDFYTDLQQEPELIHRFADIVLRKADFDSQPELTQALLSRYLDGSHELKPGYRSLRQFIASLQGMQWPPTLLPLLLLSQDPVTRQFGDRARPLYEALVSGDMAGVVTYLGREHDNRLLSIDAIRLLRDLDEELHREPDIRRNNASAVIAALSNRLPDEHARLLLGPLAQRTARSPELRWRIGIEKIGAIVTHAIVADRQVIAGALIEDLLRTEGDIAFRLESGQPPSLDEAAHMVQVAVPIILDIYRDHSLSQQHERALLNWLEIRRVAIDGKETEFPFSDLEGWMATHEVKLLPALDSRYTRLVITEFEAERIDGLNIERILTRSSRVFDGLWQTGGTRRVDLWEQINSLVGVRPGDAVALAWKYVEKHVSGPDTTVFARFINTFTTRLIKEIDEPEIWELDWSTGGQSLIALVASRGQDLTSADFAVLEKLADTWSTVENTANFAVQLLDQIIKFEPAVATQIITLWIPRLLTELPNLCLDWLASHYETFADPQQQELVAQLNQIHQRFNLTDDESNRYRRMIAQLPMTALRDALLQTHLSNVLAALQTRYDNQHNYLLKIFPVVPEKIPVLPQGQLGSLLASLMANTVNNPEIYGWLHAQMAPVWPSSRPELAPYDPASIFTDAQGIATRHASSDHIVSVLQSLHAMVQRSIVSETFIGHLLETAYILWPYHRQQSMAIFNAFNQAITEPQIANLMEAVEPTDEETMAELGNAWEHFASILSVVQRIVVTQHVLDKPVVAAPRDPDPILHAWVIALGRDAISILQSIVVGDDVNDAQRRRIWFQIEATIGQADEVSILNLVSQLLVRSDAPATVQAIFEAEGVLSGQFPGKDRQYVLSKTLLVAFLATPSVEVKNRLAGWLKRTTGGGSVLREITGLGQPTQEDIEILATQFGKSRYLDKLRHNDTEDG